MVYPARDNNSISSPSQFILEHLIALADGVDERADSNEWGARKEFLRNSANTLESYFEIDDIEFWLLADGHFDSITGVHWNNQRFETANQALQVLSGLSDDVPEIGLFRRSVRDVIFFESDARNSFFHPALPMCIFVNWKSQQSMYHIIEEILHQSSHSAVHLISSDCGRYVSGSATSDFSVEHDADFSEEMNPIVRFHSLVTLTYICEVTYKSLAIREIPDHRLVLGRLAFSIRKLAQDLKHFIENTDLLKRDGIMFLKLSFELYKEITNAHEAALRKLDFTDQPYVFDENMFLLNNP